MVHQVLLRKLAQQWALRRKSQGYKPGTEEHDGAQLEFWTGAYAVLEILGPSAPSINPMVLVILSVGRDCVEEFDKEPSDDAA